MEGEKRRGVTEACMGSACACTTMRPQRPPLPHPHCTIEKKVLPIATKVTDKWTSTNFFKGLVKKVFDRADLDNNGVLSEAELYVCILRVYDEVRCMSQEAAALVHVSPPFTQCCSATVQVNFRLPTYVRPPSRKMVQALLKKNDSDSDGNISFDEFLAIMRQLFGVCSLDNSVVLHISFILVLRMLVLPTIAALIIGSSKWVGGWMGIARFVPAGMFVIALELAVKAIWAQTFAD
jgi:hypothetical protein